MNPIMIKFFCLLRNVENKAFPVLTQLFFVFIYWRMEPALWLNEQVWQAKDESKYGGTYGKVDFQYWKELLKRGRNNDKTDNRGSQ